MYMVCILKFSSAESDNSSDQPQDEGDDEHDNCDSRPDNSVSLLVAVKSGDLACIVNLKEQRPLTGQEKLYVLDHSFMPHSRYNFPSRTINGCKRHFQSKWLSTYNGLVYSESTNGGYCKYCVLFARYSPKLTELGVFVSKPFTNFKKATEKLNQHFFEKQFYKSAVETALMFHKVQYNQMPPVDKQLRTLQQ